MKRDLVNVFLFFIFLIHSSNTKKNGEKPTIHLVSYFDCITRKEFEDNPYVQKVLKFSKMMHLYGWKIVEYGNSQSESEADEFVEILSGEEFKNLPKMEKEKKYVEKLKPEITKRVEKEDLILHFDLLDGSIVSETMKAFHLSWVMKKEEKMMFSQIFESYAWLHYRYGSARSQGKNFDFVIPGFFDLKDWKVTSMHLSSDKPIAFLTDHYRESKSIKKFKKILEILPQRNFRISGQGDFDHFFAGYSNVVDYGSILNSKEKKIQFLQGSVALLITDDFLDSHRNIIYEAQMMGMFSNHFFNFFNNF